MKDSKTIVFITGAFVHHSCWDQWIGHFTERGYSCSAPPWMYKDASVTELRSQHPDSDIASIRLSQLVRHYAEIVETFSEKPILIGHSLGGLIAQILVNQGLAAAGVAIHSVPPKGVLPLEISFFRAGWKALGLFSSVRKTYLMSLSDWQYAMTNGMTPTEQNETYEKYAIPESKMVIRDGMTSAANVDFIRSHAPLLMISGSTDNLMPAALNRRNFKKYGKNGSVTEYKEFAGRNHFVLGLSTWHEEADFILDWLAKI